MNTIRQKIESLLFISIRPMTLSNLKDKVGAKKLDEVKKAVDALKEKYNIEGSGIMIQHIDDKVQMVTAKESADLVREFLKDETTGELTPASLETLTVIAYRGPITKAELELIRGVNCSLILRNLLIRGLVEERKGKDELASTYQITFDFLQYLGLREAKDLPDFEKLNSDDNLKALLNPDAVAEEHKTSASSTGDIQPTRHDT